MKNRDNKITINNLVYALLFLVIGMVLLTDTGIVELASKVIGCIFITVGIIKTIIYIYMKGKVGNYRLNNLLVGLILTAIGVCFICLSGTIDWAIRIIVGLWCVFAGVNRMIFAFTYKKYYSEGFKVYFITAIFMLILGIVILSGQLISKIVGILIIVYAISEIYNYVYYKIKGKEFPSDEKVESKLPALKNDKVVDAVIEEDTTK